VRQRRCLPAAIREHQPNSSVLRCSSSLESNSSRRVPYHVIMLEEIRRKPHEFDILHFHIDFLHAPFVHDFVQRTSMTGSIYRTPCRLSIFPGASPGSCLR
jgi:hypothetical protein